jgi:hypothetical protein
MNGPACDFLKSRVTNDSGKFSASEFMQGLSVLDVVNRLSCLRFVGMSAFWNVLIIGNPRSSTGLRLCR